MKTRVQRCGNSLAVRIPRAVADKARLEDGTLVDVSLIAGAVVVRPISRTPTLDELLEGVTHENIHGEVDWGPPVGKEIW